MAYKNQSLLGIELREGEARVVLTQLKGGKPTAVREGRSSLPPGAFSEGCVHDPALVAASLRELLNRIGAKDVTDAVFGVAFERVVFRAFTIPDVPDAEVSIIVAGEVDHFGLLASDQSAYDFVYMTTPRTELEPTERTVAVFGVDGDVTAGIREIASQLGLNVRALEPASYAMYRAAMMRPHPSGAVAALMISAQGSEIAFVHDGALVAYRRIETVARMPVTAGSTLEAAESARQLAVEVSRILDYLEREHPEIAVAERLLVVVDDPALETISALIGDQLSLNVEMVRPLTSGSDNADAAPGNSEEESCYSAAFGLAMHYAQTSIARVQPIDLFTRERSLSTYQVAQKNFVGSVIVSVAAVVLALMGYFLYNGQIAAVKAAALRADERSASIRSATDAVLAERAQHVGQYRALRRQGVPLALLTDGVAEGLASGVGISDLTINQDLKVVATADAVSETAMLRTVQNLQRSPLLTGVSITSFQQAPNAAGITFHLAAQTISIDRIRTPGGEEAKR